MRWALLPNISCQKMKNRCGRRQEVVSKSQEILLGYRNPTCNLNDAIFPKFAKKSEMMLAGFETKTLGFRAHRHAGLA